MSVGWNFPSNNYGALSGIGEAGIETFKGSPYKSLAREICQNSLDARRSADRPVAVEFSCLQLNTDSLPGFPKLKQAIDSCLSFWAKQNNRKTVDFFRRAAAVAGQKVIPVLRVSDFNTTGLVGSNQDYNTPWQNLVKASGVSDKGGSAGGSFGIGKSAPFACSDLRTVFYATCDMHGLKASQGVARLVSFPVKNKILNKDDITAGTGYFGETAKNRALPECLSLDPRFRRQEAGTDVFILGFASRRDWKKEVIASVLDDFLISIYLGLLEVRVEDTAISRATLPEVIEAYKDAAAMAGNYYQTLTAPDAHIITENFEGLGEIELHILIRNGLHRRVLMSRGNGMKVFDQKNFPSAIQFAGICLLKDEGINAYFREMENPQHDAWEPERHSKPAEAKKRRQGLFRYIKENILELGRRTTVAEADAEGVGEYLPDDAAPDPGAGRYEAVADSVRSIELNMSALKSAQKGFEAAARSIAAAGAEDSEGVPEGEDFDENGGGDSGNGGGGHNASGEDAGAGSGSGGYSGTGANLRETGADGEPPEPVRKKSEIHTMAVRLLLLDAARSRYRLIFTPEEAAGDGCLQIRLSGEQGSLDVNISGAVNRESGAPLRTFRNVIYLNGITAKKKMSVEFNVDYGERSSMEVILYGYKI